MKAADGDADDEKAAGETLVANNADNMTDTVAAALQYAYEERLGNKLLNDDCKLSTYTSDIKKAYADHVTTLKKVYSDDRKQENTDNKERIDD